MLVLSRKIGESIKIGDGIEITVIRVGRPLSQGGPLVKIGVTAPGSVRVFRAELLERILAKEAAVRN